MSHDAKTLWLPGMTALGCAAAIILGVIRLVPSSLWADPRLSVRVLIPGLLLSSYLAFGALLLLSMLAVPGPILSAVWISLVVVALVLNFTPLRRAL